MLYRCPYCGESAFSFTEKLGLAVHNNQYTHTSCPCCKRRPAHVAGRTDTWGYELFTFVLPLLLLLFAGWIVEMKVHPEGYATVGWLIVIAVPCAVLKASLNYFFCYFDKRSKTEREADARLQVAVAEDTALWPYVKKGEIYQARLPKRGNNEADSVIIVMAADRRKDGLELRVIQAYGLKLPAIDEPLWLITHGQRVIEGKVTAVTPARNIG